MWPKHARARRTGALANTSFLGLPMIEAFYGNANGEPGVGIVIDQLGTYMVVTPPLWWYLLQGM